ncbi:hypothetical protein FB451DRAFT_1380356 [Mycena latifolia]|nr:hypothetical protein FB451DRAFT_1380356 [Mycena latifolia]
MSIDHRGKERVTRHGVTLSAWRQTAWPAKYQVVLSNLSSPHIVVLLAPAMDNPSWNDTLRASLASCLPYLARPTADSDDTENDERVPGPGEASYAIRRTCADELEGLLAATDDGDAAADADAILLHSHLGPRGRRRAPPRTPRHIALWGFNLFGSGRGREVQLPADSADDPLHRPANTADPLQRSGSGRSAEDAQPLDDADIERRARRRARKEMRRLAKAVAQQDADADFAAGVGGSPLTPSAHRRIPAPFLPAPAPLPPAPDADALARMQAQDDDDDADLDGGANVRLAPRTGTGSGGSCSSELSSNSGSGAGYERGSAGSAPYSPLGPYAGADSPLMKPPKSKSKRSKKSKSSTTSSTLASPRQEAFGPFASAPGVFLRAICPRTARIPPTHASKHIVHRHGTSRSLCTVSLHATVAECLGTERVTHPATTITVFVRNHRT